MNLLLRSQNTGPIDEVLANARNTPPPTPSPADALRPTPYSCVDELVGGRRLSDTTYTALAGRQEPDKLP